jgi:hypothetical protein
VQIGTDDGCDVDATFCLNVINPIWGSVWGFPSIIEISVRTFEIRLISEVLVNSV